MTARQLYCNYVRNIISNFNLTLGQYMVWIPLPSVAQEDGTNGLLLVLVSNPLSLKASYILSFLFTNFDSRQKSTTHCNQLAAPSSTLTLQFQRGGLNIFQAVFRNEPCVSTQFSGHFPGFAGHCPSQTRSGAFLEHSSKGWRLGRTPTRSH